MEAILEVVKRDTIGKNEANRTRARGRIPAVVYGTQKGGDTASTVSVEVDPKPFLRIIHSSSGLNTLITLKLAGESDARVLVKEVQLDPLTHHPLHADFYRVNMDRRIRVTVPVVLRGEARGVKVDGGVIDFVQREIELETLPAEIPNAIEVDVSDLGIGDAVYLRQVAENVSWKPITDPAQMLVHVVTIKVVEEPAPGAAAETAVAGAAPAEPEVIKKGKTEKEGEEAAPDAKGAAKPAADKGEKKK
jgi:large subunit ribosomal protein L25